MMTLKNTLLAATGTIATFAFFVATASHSFAQESKPATPQTSTPQTNQSGGCSCCKQMMQNVQQKTGSGTMNHSMPMPQK